MSTRRRNASHRITAFPIWSTYKVAIFGPSQVGKTAWIKAHLGLPKSAHPTLGVEVTPLRFLPGTIGSPNALCLNLWDVAGDPRYAGLERLYCNESAVVLVVARTETEAREWANKLNPVLPRILCQSVAHGEVATWGVPFGPEHLEEPVRAIVNRLVEPRGA